MHRGVIAARHGEHEVDSGVVDKDVDPAVFGGQRREGAAEGVAVRDVAHDRRALRAAPGELRSQLVEQILAPRQTDHGRAAVRQGQGDGTADAR